MTKKEDSAKRRAKIRLPTKLKTEGSGEAQGIQRNLFGVSSSINKFDLQTTLDWFLVLLQCKIVAMWFIEYKRSGF